MEKDDIFLGISPAHQREILEAIINYYSQDLSKEAMHNRVCRVLKSYYISELAIERRAGEIIRHYV